MITSIQTEIRVASVNALIVYFHGADVEQLAPYLLAFQRQLLSHLATDLQDAVPAYNSVLVYYDNRRIDVFRARALLAEAWQAASRTEPNELQAGRQHCLPVCYAPKYAPDLKRLSARAGLSEAEVIDLHTAQAYRVYAIGFAPGFAYLGQVDERIATPRLAEPRLAVPAGAVGIADRQTAVYPTRSAGGWNIIGRCARPLLDYSADADSSLQHGDLVRFEAISEQQFRTLARA